MPSNGYDDTIGDFEKLLEAVKSSAGELPATDSLRAALEWHLQEAKAAKARQQLHTAGRQRATKDLQRQLAAGRDAAIRLRSLAKSAYGPRDKRLARFGVAPVKPRVRKPRQPREQQTSAGSSSPEPAT